MKKILFISHDATRTGAPLILLELLKWLNTNHSNTIQIDVLLVQRGALEQDFKKESNKIFNYWELNKPLKFKEIVWAKLYSKFKIRKKSKETLLFETIATNNYDIVYANSVASLPLAVQMKNRILNTKLLLHIHELDTIIQQSVPEFENYIPSIDSYIAVSNLVKENLTTRYKVNQDLIALIYEFGVIKDDFEKKNNAVFTVGASGLVHWRKGSDIFLQVAKYIAQNYSEAKINFVWVGNFGNDEHIIKADIKKMGLEDIVQFVGEQTNPATFYSDFDVFLLTSREDPFPLVCIEVAHLEKPIICFNKASGTTEIIKKGGGFVVPYLDVSAMAEKIMWYYSNPDQAIADGEKAKQLFSGFTAEKMIPLLYEQINLLINET